MAVQDMDGVEERKCTRFIDMVGSVVRGRIYDLVAAKFEWDRSFSEPDLTDPFKHLNRFLIKHPHEYISVDDLKFFRRKKPPDCHTKSNISLYNSDEPVLPFGSLKTEYQREFHPFALSVRPALLRRSTSLHLEGLMHHLSEHQEQYHWYSPEDWQFCRTYPIKNPENLSVGGNVVMDAEYRSSYLSHPMVDRTTKILPREVFRVEPDPSSSKPKVVERTHEEVASINKLAQDKFKRDIAAQEQHKCHLQQRSAKTKYSPMPSEYRRQFVQYPGSIEKAHSIPQITHIKMQGEFNGVPEYQDSFKMYANYSKSAPIKKVDNLRMSGSESIETSPIDSTEVPEYREKFSDPPKDATRGKSLKTEDHLHPRGEFSKDIPEYHESFRDPQITQMPERGKCREPYLRLKGKIEFNPEYRNTYLDFPRSRPIVKKPASCFRLPTSSSTSVNADSLSPRHTSRRKYKSSSPNRMTYNEQPTTDITNTPEYRRAHYNYQIRERTPPRKVIESDGGGNSKLASRKNSNSSMEAALKPTNKRRPTRNRQSSIVDPPQAVKPGNFENVGHREIKKPAKFGRRAEILHNAANCREHSSIVEGNPKYTSALKNYDRENEESFVVLKEPCKRSNWMKKSWYES